MSAYVPVGYITVGEALERLGGEQFESEWTGKESRARSGLISLKRWLEIKDLPPARGSDAPGGGPYSVGNTKPVPNGKPEDPADPAYQEEFEARVRYEQVSLSLRQRLEIGGLSAVILDPFTGRLHTASTSLWRRHDADRILSKGQAPMAGSFNKGTVLIKEFENQGKLKALPRAKIDAARDALRNELGKKNLTRSQQAVFVRRSFPNYQITERQMSEILQGIPVPRGRPRKIGQLIPAKSSVA